MKKVLKVLGIIALCFFILAGGLLFFIKSMGTPEDIQAMQINPVDFSTISDGTYKGSCDLSLVQVELTVKVSGKKVTEIIIDKHKNGMGKKAEKIVDSIIEKQSLEVDIISGATTSSKAILKAVETALSNK